VPAVFYNTVEISEFAGNLLIEARNTLYDLGITDSYFRGVDEFPLTVQRAVELRIYVKSPNGYTVALAQVLSEPDNIIAAYEAEKVSDRSFYLTESALKDTTDVVRQEITKLEEQSSTILDKEKVARVWRRLGAMSAMIWEASALWAPADNPAALEDLKRILEVTAHRAGENFRMEPVLTETHGSAGHARVQVVDWGRMEQTLLSQGDNLASRRMDEWWFAAREAKHGIAMEHHKLYDQFQTRIRNQWDALGNRELSDHLPQRRIPDGSPRSSRAIIEKWLQDIGEVEKAKLGPYGSRPVTGESIAASGASEPAWRAYDSPGHPQSGGGPDEHPAAPETGQSSGSAAPKDGRPASRGGLDENSVRVRSGAC
jgi:acetolactate synthase regulatory subunit